MKCNSTPGCVYYSNQRQCKSKPVGSGTQAQELSRLTAARQRDMRRQPDFYRQSAATVVQRTRRGYNVRNPRATYTVRFIGMDGSEAVRDVSRHITLPRLKMTASESNGIPVADMTLMHENLEAPIQAIEEVRAQIDPASQSVSLYTMREPRNRADLFNELVNLPVMRRWSRTGNPVGPPLEVEMVAEEDGTQVRRLKLSGTFVVGNGRSVTGLSGRDIYPHTWVLCMPRGTDVWEPGRGWIAPRVRGINVPSSIAAAPELESLILENAPFLTLPESLGSLTNLVTVEVNMTVLRELPSSIGRLQNLRNLSIVNSCIDNRGIPESLGDLVNLKSLEIINSRKLFITGTATNPMVNEPTTSRIFGGAHGPSRADVRHAPSVIPILSRLVNLETLNLSCLYLTSLPFEQMRKLQVLVLNATFLGTLPAWVGALPDLAVLSLNEADTRFINYPPGSFPSLITISVTNTPNLTPNSLRNVARLRQAAAQRAGVGAAQGAD